MINASPAGYTWKGQKFELFRSETLWAILRNFYIYQYIAPVPETGTGKVVAVGEAIELPAFVSSVLIGFAEKYFPLKENILKPIEITANLHYCLLF